MKKILVTGAAGFIGAHLVLRLLKDGHRVVGVDNINDYYDPSLKDARLALFSQHQGFDFYHDDISDKKVLEKIFDEHAISQVVHLAAQAGVRYSLENPDIYMASNVMGFFNVLENCRHHHIEHLVFSSSSSVYGANTKQPFSEGDHTDHQIALYAATKKAGEVMAHSYAASFDLPCTALRFFTVYGPWGRPDMALFKFTKNILAGRAIDVFNDGDMCRDFTYIDDVIECVVRALNKPATKNPAWSGQSPDAASSFAPFNIYNVGNGHPVQLLDFILAVEEALGKTAVKNFLPLQAGDVVATYADMRLFDKAFDFLPQVPVKEGVKRFVGWYVDYYGQ